MFLWAFRFPINQYKIYGKNYDFLQKLFFFIFNDFNIKGINNAKYIISYFCFDDGQYPKISP